MQGEIRVRRWKADELPAGWFKRATAEGKEETDALEEKVRGIVEGVRENGDKGLLDFALKFDKSKQPTPL